MPLKFEMKLQKDFEKHERQKTDKQWFNKAVCATWMYSTKIKVGKKEEQLLIASCLTFMGINIATDKILFGCKVRQQWNWILWTLITAVHATFWLYFLEFCCLSAFKI